MGKGRGYIAVGIVFLFLGMAAQPAVAQENRKDDLKRADARDGRELSAPYRELGALVAQLKASTTDPSDSDGDGLPDSVERVIGTDSCSNDTDFDRINDSREIELGLDPKQIDSNRDGLPDYFEVKDVPLDLDGDGVANSWDWDNDNDGVVDSIDSSPFAKTGTFGEFSLSVNSSGKATYIELQLRTRNPSNMRLLEETWDWPWDNQSLMQDLDNSVDDLTATPMLEVETGVDIDPLAVAEYGIFVSDRTAYVPLLPVWDLGNTVALVGKLFVPGLGGPANFSLNISLKWRITGLSDHTVFALRAPNGSYISVNLTGAVKANASALSDSEGLEFIDVGDGKVALKSFNGLYLRQPPSGSVEAVSGEIDTGCEFIKESRGGVKIVLKSVCNDKYLFLHANGSISASADFGSATSFDLVGPWYRPVPTNLVVYPEDFMLTGLSVEENFGSDFGVFYGASVANLTAANLMLAHEFLRNGTNNVSVMPAKLAARNITFQFKKDSFEHRDRAVVATTGKGLRDMLGVLPDHQRLPITHILEDRCAVVELSEVGGASYIKGNSLLADVGAQKAVTTKTLKTNWYDTDNDTHVDMKGILNEIEGYGLPEDSSAFMAVLSVIWNAGEYTVTNAGHEQMEFQVPDLEKWTDIAANVATLGLTVLGYGLEQGFDFPKIKMGLPRAGLSDEYKARLEIKNFEAKWDKMVHKNKVDSGCLKWAKRLGTVVDVLGMIADIGFALFTLIAMGCASGWTTSATWSAVLTAVMTIAYGMALGWIGGMLAMCGLAGWVFAGVFLLAVAFSEFFAWLCDGNSWSEGLVQKFLSEFTKQVQRSRVDLSVADQKLTIHDWDQNGLDVGDQVAYECDFNGTVTATQYTKPVFDNCWWQEADLNDSYIKAGIKVFDPISWSWVDRWEFCNEGQPSYYIPPGNFWGQKTTRYNSSQYVNFTSPTVNHAFITVLIYNFKYFYEDCTAFFAWSCTREAYAMSKYEVWSVSHIDVLPGSIDGLASWSEIASRDEDGDGLNNTAETDKSMWLWDTDADGLGDRYERVIGADPEMADGDGDGLDDRLEVQLGTNATSRDSDGDGIEDATEHRGWVINFNYSGRKFHWHVASDPRLNDTDADGLDDYNELHHALNPISGDTDGDGVPDPADYKQHYITHSSYFVASGLWAAGVHRMDMDGNGIIYAIHNYYINGEGMHNTVVRFASDGTELGNFGDFLGRKMQLWDVSVDPDGEVYVLVENQSSVPYHMEINRYSPTGAFLGHLCDTGSSGTTMAVDGVNGWLFTGNPNEGTIERRHLSNGTKALSWQVGQKGSARYYGMTVGGDGHLYCAIQDSKSYGGAVVECAPDGTLLAVHNESAYGGTYVYPIDVAVSPDGELFILEDDPANRLQKLDAMGDFAVSFTGLTYPSGVVYAGDHLFVADINQFMSVYGRILNLTHTVYYTPPNETFNYTDTDQDGLTDVFENAGWKLTVDNATGHFSYNVTSDPLLNDTDGDGLLDRSERDLGTDPRKIDTDGDGRSDYDEVWGGGRALQGRTADWGGCGGRAGQATDPLKWDTDGDNLGDGTELTFASDPTANDTDGDGLLDEAEFELGANPKSNDTDCDGLDDLAETEFGSGALTPDADGDYLLDGAEHALGTDPNSNDTDGDGLIEAFEMIYVTDPKDPDTDDDGLPDGFEIENLLNASCNDTDHDNVSDAEELARGLNPFCDDSDGDWIPDELDLDYTLVLDDEVVLVADPDAPLDAFASVLASEVNVVNATPAELLGSHKSAPYIVLVGRPDAENGTAGAVVRDLLEGTGEAHDAMLSGEEHIAVRYGFWAPTQTVVMLTSAGAYDALKTLSLLKSMKMTVTRNSVHAEYINPRACFLQDFMDTVLSTNASVWTKLTEMATFNVTISGYGAQDAPVALKAENGLEAGAEAMDRYLDVSVSDNLWSEGVDLILGGQVKLFYTAADLDRTGDGEADDPEDLNETTLSLYWYNETDGNWSVLSDAAGWVNGTGVNTTDISIYGREYAGCVWADVEHLSLFGIGGLVKGGLEVVARAGKGIDVEAGAEVLFNGSLSSGNGAILNYTWTFTYDGGTVTLFGPVASFVFRLPGTYTVTLTVIDSLGLSASDTLTISARERPSGKWVLRVGPVTDENGTALQGALVKLAVGGEAFTNTTDSSGFALFELGPDHVSKGVAVIATMEGYLPAEYSTNITAARVLERNPPPLVKIRPGEEFTLVVGPVQDRSGNALEGATVTITVNGTDYSNTTDGAGIARFMLPLALVGKDVGVRLEKKGFRTASYGTRISADRSLEQDPPGLEKAVAPKEGGLPAWALAAAAAAALLAVACAAALYAYGRKKKPAIDAGPAIDVEVEAGATGTETAGPPEPAEGQRPRPPEAPAAAGEAPPGFAVEDIFLMYIDGRLILHTTRRIKADMDADIMTSMLTAVQAFVKESLGMEKDTELGAMEYGDNKILLQKGRHVVLAAVIEGSEPADLRDEMKSTISNIEGEYGPALASWDGHASKLAGTRKFVSQLGARRAARPVAPTGRAEVFLKGELEFYQGFVRLKVAVKNAMETFINDASFRLICKEAVLRLDHIEPSYPLKGDEVVLGNIEPGEKKTVAFYLDPQMCTESFLEGILSYKDARGNLEMLKLPRKVASVVCPIMYTDENINTAMLKRMATEELEKKDSKVFAIPPDITPRTAFDISKSAIQHHDMRLVREFREEQPFIGEAWYYGKAKGREDKLVVRARVLGDRNILEFFVASSSTLMLTGMLAELKSDLNKELSGQRGAAQMRQVTEPGEVGAVARIRTLLDIKAEAESPPGETETSR